MAYRMLCTDCLHVGEPDTVLEGSDHVELAAWCCFVVPGLLYCWWRHLCRAKVCPQCGSQSLMRESRASAARRVPQAEPAGGARIRSLTGMGFDWPRPFGSPRGRLRSGGIGAALVAFACGAWLLSVLDPTSTGHASQAAVCGWVLCATWMFRQLQQFARERRHADDCRAWDADGRALRIERV